LKYLLVLLVVVGALWVMFGRSRRVGGGARAPKPAAPKTEDAKADAGKAPQAMLACAHCGVHLPQAEAVHDAAGVAFCSEAHRLAGPR
jgi:uncharacterized protein